MNYKKKFFLSFFAISTCLIACKHKDSSPATNPGNTSGSSVSGSCPTTTSLASAEKIQIFPSDYPLNLDVSKMDKDLKSDDILNAIDNGTNRGLKADFGSGKYNGAFMGIPYVVVCSNQDKIKINFRANDYDDNYSDQSETGPYAIPLTAPIEGAGSSDGPGDSHVIAIDIDNKLLYELYNADTKGNTWNASCGAIYDLKKNVLRPEGYTSADGAGLPIFPALVRYEEVLSGTIDHAIRFTLQDKHVYHGYIHPAVHRVKASGSISNSLPMGARMRLRSDYDVSKFSKEVQVILNAMKKYGIILADKGSDMYFSGAPDERWNNDDLQKLSNVKVKDFEVIKIGTISEIDK